jgi:hypothetical protein
MKSYRSGHDHYFQIAALANEVLHDIPFTDLDLSGSNRQLCITVPEVETAQDEQ